ncbi:MAG: TIGR01777 family protein [SAR202 cluster bacterium]|jgi:uncharacterized protein (TIGR01777 family)|nr:MAG: TIGR01777 family protein [SAR202 cluster bacterium]MQG74324.1 TIGR01777 family protein [SAR202 cluster bacterium]|tara:strand:- start:4924 stop:6357 length:1434 start_codon:yes stop_codon:yes gene_type:complete
MKILMVGATGFIGKATVAFLQGKNHEVSAWVRNTDKAIDMLGDGVRLISSVKNPRDLKQYLEETDVVINLAGRPLAGVRWTDKRKLEFYESRVVVTNLISESIAMCENPPKIFISASAVGVYGNSGAAAIDEESAVGQDYLSQLSVEWEMAANRATESGVRVCNIRIGVVLGREGGMLQQLIQSFDFGVGSYLGDGKQKVPWIHLIDVVRAINFCIDNEELNGPVNLTAPHATSGKEFAKNLASLTNAFIVIPMPKFVLKLIFGEGEVVLTNSQNPLPAKLLESGFRFEYDVLRSALEAEIHPEKIVVSKAGLPAESPVHSSKPQYELKTSVSLKCDHEKAFNFFSSPLNLGLTTPSWLNFKITDMPLSVSKDCEIAYEIRLWFFPIKWRTKILEWNPHESFIDMQKEGPYRLWVHSHFVESTSRNTSLMTDIVRYSVPGGFLGRLAHYLFIKKSLTRIFGYRRNMIRMRLGFVTSD